MKMKHIAIAALLVISTNTAFAAVSATGSITCGSSPVGAGYLTGLPGYSTTPTINVTLNTGSDAGKPGLFWLGVLTPDQQTAFVLPLTGQWEKYQGGLYPPQARFDNGLPGSISLQVPIPPYYEGNMQGGVLTNTFLYQGHTVYVGHGALSPDAVKRVADRRTYLNSIREDRIARGKWSHHYDSDDQYKWALAQKDMTDGPKWGPVVTIPYLDCNPDNQGG